MNEYELASVKMASDAVQISKDALFVSEIGVLISGGSLLFAIVAAVVAIRSLRHIAGQFTAAQLNALLLIEQDMAQRRQRFSDIDVEIRQNGGTPTDEHERKFKEAKESYLNSLERLASCILLAKFNEAELKVDYRDYIADTIRQMEGDFGHGSRFRKIKKLHDRWADS